MDKYAGKKLDGRYEIETLIGIGGMAFVYKAYDEIDDRTVAIKILKDEFLGNNDFLRRFKNESKAIAVLSHPNIVKVYDVSFGDRIQYIVMEYVDGITLKDYISKQKDIRWNDALYFITQILKALQHAHEKGIIHRDIKPHNIMLLKDGTIKVTDFGIAKFARNETRTMTEKAIGSVHYIAPEQARGDLTDAKADIYSVGVMLYEMLTGKLPFEADNAVSVAIMQLQTDPKPLREINEKIPEGLEEITLKAMQKDPDKRYKSAEQMLNDIEIFRKNPDVKFNYEYDNEENQPKYINSVDNDQDSNYNKNLSSKNDKGDLLKEKTKPFLFGIGIAAVIFLIVFGIITLVNSCGNKVRDVDIPNFVGMQYDDIIKAKNKGEYDFNFIKEDGKDLTKSNGEVLDQNPKTSSKKVKSNSDIKLIVNNTGVSKVLVPDVKSLKEADAVSKIKSLGLNPSVISIVDDDTAAGIVKNTDPVANTSVDVGSTVNIYVGKGPSNKKVSVPNVVNDSTETAKKKIEAAGLKIGSITEKTSNKDKGIVLETDPLPTIQVTEGSVVNLVVSSGKKAESTVEVHVKLPSKVSDEVLFKAFVDGQLTVSKVLVPEYNNYYTISVTGSSGISTVVIHLNDIEYWTYYVDFDNNGRITDEKNENFVLPSSSSEISSQPSSSSQNVSSSGTSSELSSRSR